MSNTEADETYRNMIDAWSAGEYAFALEVSRDLLRKFPDYDIGWLLQGVMLYELARYDEAEKTLRRAIQLIPDKSLDHGYVHMGHLCRDRGDYEEAERYYRKALTLAPDNTGRHIFLGAVLAKKGGFQAAERVHRDGTRCSKGDLDEAYLNLGYVLRAQERYNEALECFAKALKVTPDYEQAIVGKRDMERVLEYLAGEA
jgi:tetratricopeptide (TPR) repeat protein